MSPPNILFIMPNQFRHDYPGTAGADELYDLKNDPDELRNIASEHPDRVADLAQRLRLRFR